MNNLIKAYDLGSSSVVETCQRISVDELVRTATKIVKKRIVEAQIEALGVSISLSTSRTRFDGERLWFVCPACNNRSGVLYRHPSYPTIACRKCFGLVYKKQRYKGMIENI
jgi:hypothetical protein